MMKKHIWVSRYRQCNIAAHWHNYDLDISFYEVTYNIFALHSEISTTVTLLFGKLGSFIKFNVTTLLTQNYKIILASKHQLV